MPKLREWLIRLWQTLYTRRDDRDLEQELRTHLELAADDARQGASSPDRAARAAKIQAGPLPATMDALRDQHSVPWLRDLGHDLRYASRTLRTSPSFSVVAVLTLGLGIGVNTAIFSLTDAVLFKPLPGIHHAERLVALYSDNRETDNIEYFGFPYPDYLALRELDDVLVDLTAFVRVPFVLTGSLGNAPVVGDLVSGSYFSVFGAVPEEGRLLNEGDDTPGTSPVAVISYRLWQERFGGRLPIVGETLTLDHIPLTVVGVAPRGFRGSLLDWYGDTPIDVFAPYWLLERVFPGPFAYVTDRSWVGPQLIGRLQPGVPVNVARTALVTRVRQLAAAFPDTNADRTLIVLPSDRARFWPGRYGQTVRLVALLNISTLVLLGIACFNLANLLLTRTLARRREIGLRLAIGATRSRLTRQLLVEVALLTLAGGLAGLGVAWICVQVLAASPTPFGAPLYLAARGESRSYEGSTQSIRRTTLTRMAMGTRETDQPPLWIATSDLPTSPGHPFYARLTTLLDGHHFDRFVEGLCDRFYAPVMGRPSLAPGRYFRLLLVGYFEGIDSERGMAWRATDSLAVRSFLRLAVDEAPPDHSTIARTRRLIDLETHRTVFTWVQQRLVEAGRLTGKTIAIDATTLEANAAMRSIGCFRHQVLVKRA